MHSAETLKGEHMAQLECFEMVLVLGIVVPHTALDPASMLVRASRGCYRVRILTGDTHR